MITYKNVIVSADLYGCELGLSIGKHGTSRCGKYLDLKGKMKQKNEENCIVRTLITRALTKYYDSDQIIGYTCSMFGEVRNTYKSTPKTLKWKEVSRD
jgi:hypothetical protein